jgi:ankyrin repeat protein
MNAAGFGNKEVVELLLQRGADVNAKTQSGWTALMSAALSGQTEITKILLDAGADPNAKDVVKNETAADIAKEKGHAELVTLLKQRGGKSK